jgi:hypothetical protein
VVIEAAFEQKQWDRVVPKLQQVALLFIVICELDAGTSARRHLERGLNDPNREFYHGDKRVSIYKQTGQFMPGGPYDAPRYDVPTLSVFTCKGYVPEIEQIMAFVRGTPNKPARGDA